MAVEPSAETLRILFPSAIGPLGIELRDQTVTRVVIDPKGENTKAFTPFEDLDGSDFLDELFGRLSEYFAGARKNLELDVDIKGTGLPRFDQECSRRWPRSRTAARGPTRRSPTAAGHPEGYRQVLAVLVENPLPIIVPCHRVVTNKSGVGSYIAGKDKKKWLLKLEKDNREDAV